MTMPFIFGALAHEGDRFVFRDSLQQAQREFLAVVFDGAVVAVDGAVGEEFLFVTLGEFGQINLTGFKCAQGGFGGAGGWASRRRRQMRERRGRGNGWLGFGGHPKSRLWWRWILF